MSQRHIDALERIRMEYDDVVSALKKVHASGSKRGAPGNPSFAPSRLDEAMVTASDAYCLLLIATAEGFMRDYLLGLGIQMSSNAGLSPLINRSRKEINQRLVHRNLRLEEAEAMHDLRQKRNLYAHGHSRSVFPTVARVTSVLAKYLALFP